MTLLQGLILGTVQGITEFLPVSSDGHLNLVQYLLGFSPSLTLDIFLHTATLLSVLFFFRHELPFFIKNIKYILIGSVPAAIVGLFLKSQVETISASPGLLPLFFLITSVFVLSTKLITPKDKSLSFTIALAIGTFQALAILPGVSRSASTIMAGLLLGLSATQAFKFSFSLFIPASLGAILLDFDNLNQLSWFQPTLGISFVLTSIVGVVALYFLQHTLTSSKYWSFGFYTLLLALVLFFWF